MRLDFFVKVKCQIHINIIAWYYIMPCMCNLFITSILCVNQTTKLKCVICKAFLASLHLNEMNSILEPYCIRKFFLTFLFNPFSLLQTTNTRCLCWHTRLWTRQYRSTSANASIAASTHGHYARQLRHCSSNHSLAPTSRNVLFDAPRRLSGTSCDCHISEATRCLFSNLV